jgi:hypothetical protein
LNLNPFGTLFPETIPFDMKNSVLIMILSVGILGTLQDLSAQAIEITGFTGYQLGGTARLYDADLKINDAMNYGGKIAVGMSASTFVEISYMRSDTKGSYYPYYMGGDPVYDIPFSSNYIQIGGLLEKSFGKVAPFATIALGLVVWDPKPYPQLNTQLTSKA